MPPNELILYISGFVMGIGLLILIKSLLFKSKVQLGAFEAILLLAAGIFLAALAQDYDLPPEKAINAAPSIKSETKND